MTAIFMSMDASVLPVPRRLTGQCFSPPPAMFCLIVYHSAATITLRLTLTPATAEMASYDLSKGDVAEDRIQRQLIATVFSNENASHGNDTPSHGSNSEGSSFAVLKKGLVGADIAEGDADMLIARCLDGVKAAHEVGGVGRRNSKENDW